MKDSELLQWLHDRCIHVYNEKENVDFLIHLRKIIEEQKENEKTFELYMEYIKNKKMKERKFTYEEMFETFVAGDTEGTRLGDDVDEEEFEEWMAERFEEEPVADISPFKYIYSLTW